MNESGQNLKEARESSGVSLEEASKDLDIKPLILENIEEGNIGCFKDIFVLKDYIKNYAKYLGFDDNKVIDEFNEYLFEYTSKIPVEEIEKAVLEKSKEKNEEEISSPYTNPVLRTKKIYYALIYLLIIILIVIAVIWSVKQITINNEVVNYVSYLK